jgi:hypothetical protein
MGRNELEWRGFIPHLAWKGTNPHQFSSIRVGLGINEWGLWLLLSRPGPRGQEGISSIASASSISVGFKSECRQDDDGDAPTVPHTSYSQSVDMLLNTLHKKHKLETHANVIVSDQEKWDAPVSSRSEIGIVEGKIEMIFFSVCLSWVYLLVPYLVIHRRIGGVCDPGVGLLPHAHQASSSSGNATLSSSAP